jgi:predicted short-subunit dehydrogenase-like oxidoreductase (DUF2520 family)
MLNIVIIGSGNIAFAMAKACLDNQINVLGIYSKTPANAKNLSTAIGINFFNQINEIPNDADLYLLCVNDDAIQEVAKKISTKNGIIVHFSGIKPLNTLNFHVNTAVIWPLESINKKTFSSFKNTTLCIEANSSENYRIIESFADKLSSKVLDINSEQRAILHLAATISNNFTNHLIALTKITLEQENLDYHLLYPMLLKTIENAFQFDPKTIQTGPAQRNDEHTMETHLTLIKSNQVKDLYKLISKSILQLKLQNNA